MDKLDKLLKEQKIDAASGDLASRIINRAASIQQKPNIWQIFKSFCNEFKLPEPALSLASLVFIGFLVGFATYSNSDAYADDIYSQLLEEENLL